MYDAFEIMNSRLAEGWMALVFLLSFILIAYIRVNYHKRIIKLFKTLGNSRLLQQIMREELVFSHRASVLLLIIYLSNAALLLYLCDKHFALQILDGDGFLLFGKYFLLLTSIHVLKNLSIRLVDSLANGEFGLKEYDFSVFLFNKAVGIVLLPLSIAAAYLSEPWSKTALVIGLSAILLFYLVRLGKGFLNALQFRAPSFYIILYLCTLEILPVLVVFRVLKN